ncbi:hypothetical protein DB346_19185 [Verrucomicrobia bacterium LW23]|nr:hypothetical protein DB346_19185 [Verrucomicrobia bacterium LW23]
MAATFLTPIATPGALAPALCARARGAWMAARGLTVSYAALTLSLGFALAAAPATARAEQPAGAVEQRAMPDAGRVEPGLRAGTAAVTSPRQDGTVRVASLNTPGRQEIGEPTPALQPLPSSPRGYGRATLFSQRHESLPNGGQMYCGPAAAVNALGWLGQTAPLRNDTTWLAAMRELGACMNTDPVQGTTPAQLLDGLERYLREKFSPMARISYLGCREVPGRFSEGMRPQLWNMRSSGREAVMVNIGWYKRIEGTSIYQRVGGHWVSLKEATLTSEGDVLVVLHDPYPRNGGREHRTIVTPLADGTLTGGDVRGRCMARGFFKLDDRYPRITKADCGIIDGVVIMDIGTNPTNTAQGQGANRQASAR